LLEAQSGKQVFSETHRLIKDRKYLLLSKLDSNVIQSLGEESLIIKKNTKQFQTPFGILFFDEADAIFGKRTNVIHVDKDKLNFPLTIRKWQKGDYFYPFGMQGKKKLSKYFKDEKLSLLDKENIWLLCSESEILWVINKRADNRFKVTEKTKQIIKIELK
jgi:tRNA(Ile)-lysidine synthase